MLVQKEDAQNKIILYTINKIQLINPNITQVELSIKLNISRRTIFTL